MRIGSLFSGIGGLELGLEWAGLGKTIWQVENNDYATKVLEKHWPEAERFRDVREVGEENLEPVDLICGGFPCQPFSCAGKRKGTRDDRHLWPEMVRIIREVRPTWVVGENVPSIVNMELDTVLSDLESEGYETATFVLPACGVDAPHRRYRVFVLGHSDHARNGTPRCGTNRDGQTQDEGRGEQPQHGTCGCGEDVADTESEQTGGIQPGGFQTDIEPSGNGRKQTAVWLPEPDVGRVAHGVPSRVDRLKCLGNAVVPQVSMAIGLIIKEWIEQNTPT